MSHPFDLTIEDLACLELLDQTTDEVAVEGGMVISHDFPTMAHEGIEGGIRPRPLPHPLPPTPAPTKRWNEHGGPWVSTNRFPEHGGPIFY